MYGLQFGVAKEAQCTVGHPDRVLGEGDVGISWRGIGFEGGRVHAERFLARFVADVEESGGFIAAGKRFGKAGSPTLKGPFVAGYVDDPRTGEGKAIDLESQLCGQVGEEVELDERKHCRVKCEEVC